MRQPADSTLTPRQQEIADLLTEGWTTDEIARMLAVTIKAVADDIERILRRLDPASRAEVESWAGRLMRRLWAVRPEPGLRPESDALHVWRGRNVVFVTSSRAKSHHFPPGGWLGVPGVIRGLPRGRRQRRRVFLT